MLVVVVTWPSPPTDIGDIAIKLGAIAGGQTSCKAPEIEAFEKYLPEDIDIVSCHSLHGPAVNPKGQPLVSDILSTLDHFVLAHAVIRL